jgi:tripartite-type tricarboxylate transporter receptor subunit TctC
MQYRAIAGALAFALVAAVHYATTTARADGADFFKGKTITYIVATAPGGGYDTYGRLVAEYMQRYLPGSTFVVKNVPGAGHLIGANTLFASPPDGLTIGTFNTGILYSQLIGHNGVKFDLKQMSWIGKAATDPHVIVVAEQTPIKTFEDLKAYKTPLKFATGGIGSTAYVETALLTEAMSLPIKILTGYNGTQEHLAMRRGEIDGSMGSRSTWQQFKDNGFGRFLGQFGGNDKDVPQVSSFTTDPKTLAMVKLIQIPGDIARLTAGPPGIPADRLEALRTAFRRAMEDKELQARAEKLGRPIEPAYGEEVRIMISEALNQSPESIAVLKQAMGEQ